MLDQNDFKQINTILRTQEERVNLLIQFLKESGILNEEQWKRLRALQIFPSIEVGGTA